jgi:hypothetical protein
MGPSLFAERRQMRPPTKVRALTDKLTDILDVKVAEDHRHFGNVLLGDRK